MTKPILRTLPAALLLFSLLAGPLAAQTGATKIATFDLQKVSDKYYKWQTAKQYLTKEKAKLEHDLDEVAQSVKHEQDEYASLQKLVDDPMITADERKSREKTAADKAMAIQTDESSYQEMRNEGQQKLDLEYQNLTDAVLQDIQAAVKAKARAAGYSLVLNTSSDTLQANSVVIFSNGENDITDDIIKQLNAAAPEAATTPDASKPATNPDAKKK